jgi:hypothetical protein
LQIIRREACCKYFFSFSEFIFFKNYAIDISILLSFFRLNQEKLYLNKMIEADIIEILDNREQEDNRGHEEYFVRWSQFPE